MAMNDYREKQIEHANLHFSNHKAEIKEHGGITVLNWRNQNGSSDYYVHYVFDGCFLYISGDLGSAVVHLTEKATLNALSRYINIRQGMSARYLAWREDSVRLKSMVNDSEYAMLMSDYKKTDCLCIDDLFKGSVTDADVKLAFELIDYRARNHLCTIISSELTDKELIAVDEALAGRIRKMSKGYWMVIPKDRRKNYRLR